MPRASTQNARPALRRLPTRPSRMVQAVVSRLLPLLFRSQGLELSGRSPGQGLCSPEVGGLQSADRLSSPQHP